MFVADTLSRAYLPATSTCEIVNSLEEMDHTISLLLSAEQLLQIKHVSKDEQQLRETIRNGWPQSKSNVLECLHPYYDFRDYK